MGRVTVAGGKPAMEAPSGGILASELAVGSAVKLMENGSAVEYVVVNQGKPSGGSLYDSSCDGTWLMRKSLYNKLAHYVNGVTDPQAVEEYNLSYVHSYLNNSFYAGFGVAEKNAIKQIKIPYTGSPNGKTVYSGANGLSCKVFIPSAHEVYSGSMTYTPTDGALWSYFSGGSLVAYLNGTATAWWVRTCYTSGSEYYRCVSEAGKMISADGPLERGVRPCVVVSGSAVFDFKSLLLKGAA